MCIKGARCVLRGLDFFFSTGNSALHEAIVKGPQAKSCVGLLLR